MSQTPGGAPRAAIVAGEAGGVGGEHRVGAPEALRGAEGAEAAAGVPEYSGHDGQRVRTEPHAGRYRVIIEMFQCVLSPNCFVSPLQDQRAHGAPGEAEGRAAAPNKGTTIRQ